MPQVNVNSLFSKSLFCTGLGTILILRHHIRGGGPGSLDENDYALMGEGVSGLELDKN